MRELKDYFCTYEQTQELIKIGLSKEKYGLSVEQYGTNKFKYIGFLRSQALDFFMDKKMLGEVRALDGWDNFTFSIWFEDSMAPFFKVTTEFIEFKTYHEAESALIDKLIELEKDARNG